MSQQENSKGFQWIFLASLLLIGILVIIALVNVKSQADTVSTTTAITNTAPSVSVVSITDSATSIAAQYNTTSAKFTPSAGSTNTTTSNGLKTIYITGTVSDANGVMTAGVTGVQKAADVFNLGDLTQLETRLFRSGVLITGCDEITERNRNYCYYNVAAAAGAGGCSFNVTATTSVNYFC